MSGIYTDCCCCTVQATRNGSPGEAPATQKQQQTVEENSVAAAIRSAGTAAEFDLYADAATANGANLEVNLY